MTQWTKVREWRGSVKEERRRGKDAKEWWVEGNQG